MHNTQFSWFHSLSFYVFLNSSFDTDMYFGYRLQKFLLGREAKPCVAHCNSFKYSHDQMNRNTVVCIDNTEVQERMFLCNTEYRKSKQANPQHKLKSGLDHSKHSPDRPRLNYL